MTIIHNWQSSNNFDRLVIRSTPRQIKIGNNIIFQFDILCIMLHRLEALLGK